MKSKLETRVSFFSNALPREFQRKIRSFIHLPYFKATELRTVLLYTGPFFFKNILNDNYYKHFLLLHFAIYVYVDPNLSHMYDNAKFCIEEFCLQLTDLYTSSSNTFNSHSLLHLHDFVQQCGPLDNFSAFIFENYLYLLKQRIKSGSHIVTQTVNSIINIRSLYHNSVENDPYFSTLYPNNCAIVKNNNIDIPIIITSVNDLLLSGFELKFVKSVYDYPYPSIHLGIGKYIKTNKCISDAQYVKKCVLFVDNNIHYVFPYANLYIGVSNYEL